MTARRKKRRAFLDSECEGERGETECNDEEKRKESRKEKDEERGQDREEEKEDAPLEGHQQNSRESEHKRRAEEE